MLCPPSSGIPAGRMSRSQSHAELRKRRSFRTPGGRGEELADPHHQHLHLIGDDTYVDVGAAPDGQPGAATRGGDEQITRAERRASLVDHRPPVLSMPARWRAMA